MRIITRSRGGSFVTVVSSSFHKKTRKGTPFLCFSRSIAKEIQARGFRSGKVEEELGSFRVYFSRELIQGEGWHLIERLKTTPTLLAKPLISLSSLPLSQRQGWAGWVASDVLIVQFTPLPSERLSSLQLKPQQAPFDHCRLYIHPKGEYSHLSFGAKISKLLFNQKINGVTAWEDKGTLFLMPKRCLINCSQCARRDCLPLSYRKEGNHIRAWISSYLLREYFTPDRKSRNGKVYWLRGQIVVRFNAPD